MNDSPWPNNRIVRLYPNPSVNWVQVEIPKGEEGKLTLSIFNFMGRKMQEFRNIPSRIQLNLNEYHRGIYIYQIRNKRGQVIESGKFQVLK
jgi:hypothetical protein